ncbi:unnamed protein product [Caenorhabditis auriculariae]|uniref:Oxidoreductase-like domain-containing protein n=1 Tax=Caenorhabditis auriculariae TaxID=2777116 RepID=A0A8S1HUA8_9PELO|nr:unnamed protein product [Caenorhabditis auriculariae]
MGNEHLTEPKHPEAPIPGLCCGQGCANCIYITYAHELIEYYQKKHSDGGHREKILKEIESQVEDANVRLFVISEVKATWREMDRRKS